MSAIVHAHTASWRGIFNAYAALALVLDLAVDAPKRAFIYSRGLGLVLHAVAVPTLPWMIGHSKTWRTGREERCELTA